MVSLGTMIIYFASFLPSLAAISSETDLLHSVYSKIVNNHETCIENMTYTEYMSIARSSSHLKSLYEKSISKGRSESAAKDILNKQYMFHQQTISLDRESRGRVETKRGYANSKGEMGQLEMHQIVTWDGEDSIIYSQAPGQMKGALLNRNMPVEMTRSEAQAWRTLGGNALEALKNAIESGVDIDIKGLENGTYCIEYAVEPVQSVIIVDPDQGYSIIKGQRSFQGIVQEEFTAEYQQVKPGIWFPIKGTSLSGGIDSPDRKMTFSVSNIVVNDPNFYDGLYHVEFPEGTYVMDQVSGLEYMVGEPMSYSVGDDPTTLKEVVQDALRENASEVSQDDTLLLPNEKAAVQKEIPFVLDLKSLKLLNPKIKLNSPEATAYLNELKGGHLAWSEHGFITARETQLGELSHSDHQVFTLKKEEYVCRYGLPGDIKLPYSFIATTKENQRYVIVLHKITDLGAVIQCRCIDY